MSRWIDADAVKEALKQNTPQYMWGEVLTTVNIQPYVEIVRCAECKHWNTDGCREGCGECEWAYYMTKPDDFCSYGEREGE